MGLLEQEIKELRQMNKLAMQGKIKPDEVNARLAIYTQTEKRAKMMIQATALQAKYGKKSSVNNLTKSNLIGDGTQIDMSGDTDLEMIHCHDREKNVTREDCLDYSGCSKNNKSCSDCEHFQTTRRLLLG